MQFVTLLYYKYTQLADPAAEMRSQRELCDRLGLKGRILLAEEGINGTVAGTPEATDAYMAAMAAHPLFSDIVFKVEPSKIIPFPRLRIKVRPEIVTLGVDVDPADTAPKLTPAEFHQLIQNEDIVLFDARNNYESAIGRFKGAVTPSISLFKDLPEALDDYEELKDKKVVTYCTGGIRCEKASALMKQQGFKDVAQLDGGIIKYLQAYPDGEFEGSCFVFDGRGKVTYGSGAPIASCQFCDNATDHYQNCANPRCHALMLVCESCQATTQVCSTDCSLLVEASARAK